VKIEVALMINTTTTNAWTLLQEWKSSRPLGMLQHDGINALLQGGVRRRELTEMFGPPGIGKSQFW
jgi:RecA/RadA recombinase